MLVITGEGITLHTLLAQRMAIRLEMQGMQHSRGSISAYVAKSFGMGARTKKTTVLRTLEDYIEQTFGPLSHRYSERTK